MSDSKPKEADVSSNNYIGLDIGICEVRFSLHVHKQGQAKHCRYQK